MESTSYDTEYSPGLLSLIPIFYVGWSDTVLSPSEMEFIHKKVERMDFLTAGEKEQILAWTDPGNPPDERLFRHWVQSIRGLANRLELDEKLSLAELGIRIAKLGSRDPNGSRWLDASTSDALHELETALGIDNESSRRLLYSAIDRPHLVTVQSPMGLDHNRLISLFRGKHAKDIQRLVQLLRDPVFKYRPAGNMNEYRAKVSEWLGILAKRGIGNISYPKEYGGKDNMELYCALFEHLAYSDFSLTVKFGVQFGLFGGAIQQLGTHKHHDKYLRHVGSMNIPGCFAMTETGHGSNVRDIETTATYDHDQKGFIIQSPGEQAGKEYIGNALDAKLAVVFAQLIVSGINRGVHALIVPLRDNDHKVLPGIRIVDNGYKMGLNGVDNGKIWFDLVRVPVDNLLDRFGSIDDDGHYSSPIESDSRRFFTMLGTLVAGRICVGRAALSGAKSALTIAILYGLRRRQFGPPDGPETPLMDYPVHQRRLIPALAKAVALHFSLQRLTAEYAQQPPDQMREIETLAAAFKSYTTDYVTRTIQECREACGGKGYLAENRLGAIKADTDIFTTFEGDNTVLKQLVAKGLLSDFQQEFHDEGFIAVIRHLVKRFNTTITEKNPYSIRQTDVAHLLDPDFHKNALTYRKRKLLNTLAQRMRTLLRKRVTPFEAMLRVQNHMVTLADAYSNQMTFKYFHEFIENLDESPERDLLRRVANLYALHSIETHKGWFLENGYLDGSKSKAIRRVVDSLNRELRESVEVLIRGFGIPLDLIDAEIILSD